MLYVKNEMFYQEDQSFHLQMNTLFTSTAGLISPKPISACRKLSSGLLHYTVWSIILMMKAA
jgi:hypothetical protein